MKKLFIIFLIGLVGAAFLTGCTDTQIACELSGFHIIEDPSILDQEILDWIQEIKSSTGLYKNNFTSGNYLLIALGEYKDYSIKKVEIKEDNYGYIFNITVREGESEDQGFHHPILVKTDYTDANYDIRIIYQ